MSTQKSYDKLAEEYAGATHLDEDTYRGDVTTAFVCGMLKADEITTEDIESIIDEVKTHAQQNLKMASEGSIGSYQWGGQVQACNKILQALDSNSST